MGIVSYAELIISGVYLALGLMYLRFWWNERTRRDYLAFTIAGLSYAVFAWFELGMMHSKTPEEYLFYVLWGFIPGTIALLGTAWFIRVHLQGRRWIFWTYCGLRIAALGPHLIMQNGINFHEITGVGQTTILGEALAFPIMVPNPWMVIPQVSHLLLVIFCLDASIRLWRLGEQRKALVFGTAFSLFGAAVLIVSVGVLWGLVPLPMLGTLPILFVITAMLYDMNYDMHRAAMLSEKLEEREARLTETLEQLELSAEAGHVGMWIRSIDGEILWASDKAGEIWGFPSGVGYTQDDLIQKLHPDDLERVIECVQALAGGKEDYLIDFRILDPDGKVRWIHSQGKGATVNGKRIVRGAVADITKQKIAESAIRDLSHKLINAQEEERSRVARELHDGINQNIALLSIQLGTLREKPTNLADVTDQLRHLGSNLEHLSKDVHRISHELHPAKLTQLGLEIALRGFCREFSAKYELQVDFDTEGLPQDLSPDIALCLYRITQESLQNVKKHSRATSVSVRVTKDAHDIRLSIKDNGKGFDLDAGRTKGGLGLISIDERARSVNGHVEITSARGNGSTVEVSVPLVQDERLLKATNGANGAGRS